MRRAAVAALAAVMLLAAGCDWPRDADGTLDKVRGGVLRVGVTDNPPWTVVTDDGTVAGAEARLVERLATLLDARVEWYPGSESTVMAALKDRVLDLVVGGLDAKAPWVEEASLTRPYVTMRTVVAAPPGRPVPDSLDGVKVAVRAGTAEVAALAATGAVVVPVADEALAGDLPVVVGEWLLDEAGLRATGHDIGARDHVWAVPPGENAWQVRVERLLLATTHDEVEALLVGAERLRAAS
jgi:polar amino acid transport system substrate-binding protein